MLGFTSLAFPQLLRVPARPKPPGTTRFALGYACVQVRARRRQVTTRPSPRLPARPVVGVLPPRPPQVSDLCLLKDSHLVMGSVHTHIQENSQAKRP